MYDFNEYECMGWILRKQSYGRWRIPYSTTQPLSCRIHYLMCLGMARPSRLVPFLTFICAYVKYEIDNR